MVGTGFGLQDILTGGGLAALLLTLIEFAPIKISPWSDLVKCLRWCARSIGRAINAEVLAELREVKIAQQGTRQRLDEHIHLDDERDADGHRERILRFNTELLRDMKHTREEFIEILGEIDKYERYCRDHKDYPNGRAVHAIANIGRVYDERLAKHDFL